MPRPAKKKNAQTKKSAPRRASARPSRKPVKKLKRPSLRAPRRAKRAVSARVLETPVPPQAAETPQAWEDTRIPQYYGEDRMVLLVRDPWWLFTYWEVTPGKRKQIEHQMGGEEHRTVLRVYDVTGGLSLPRCNSFFDIELNFYADNWYIDTGLPDREWMAEIGCRTASGRFFTLVRSNRVRTPAFGISDVLDEEWMLPEEIYFRLIGRSLGGPASGNSMDIRKLLEKYLKNVVSSENTPEMSKKAL